MLRLTDSAFAEQVSNYQATLYKMAFVYVRNEHDALEMVSEAVYKAYKNRKTLKNPQYFNTWIARILINTCIKHLKRNKRLYCIDEALTEAIDNSTSVETKILLHDALSHLRHEYKTTLLLRFYQDLSVRETAEVMGIPENTVKTYTNRALTELRGIIKEDVFYA